MESPNPKLVAQISVLGPIYSYSSYLRSAQGGFHFSLVDHKVHLPLVYLAIEIAGLFDKLR